MSNYTNNLFDSTRKNSAWVSLVSFVPESSRILDIGCSSGHLGQELIANKKCEVIGVDIDQADVELAKKVLTAAHVRNIEQDDISDLGEFDVVVFADVLEHLLDPIGALNKAKARLKKGGRIVFSIPNMSHVYVRLQVLEGYLEYSPIGVLDRTHLHYYDEIEVKHIFSEALLAIKTIHPEVWTFPASHISKRLKKLGLGIVNQKKFLARMDSTKASIWQFVGYAIPTNKKPEVNRPIHYVMPPEELHIELDKRTRKLQEANNENKKLKAYNDRLEEFYRNPVKGAIMRVVRRTRAIRARRKQKGS